ncbi:hypothetical protein [Legionella tunisiensis]|uniref:hypothetical protein n=1 Tax=Legionella tunisiensis TaxID=1034944 RepID=UPI0012E9A697|nr:hypothetical protein [Legionella tunisiensis]
MNKAELIERCGILLLALENLERNCVTCEKAGSPKNIREIIALDINAMRLKLTESLKNIRQLPSERPTGAPSQAQENFDRLERELLADQVKISGQNSSANRKFVAAVKEAAQLPQFDQFDFSLVDDEILHAANEELILRADGSSGFFGGGIVGYNQIKDEIADLTKTTVSEEFAKIFPAYMKAREDLLTRLQKVKDAVTKFNQFGRVATKQRKEQITVIGRLLTTLKEEHDVDLEQPPFDGLKTNASRLDAEIRGLLRIETITGDYVKACSSAQQQCSEKFAALLQIQEHLQIFVDEKVKIKARDRELGLLIVKRPPHKFQDINTGLGIIKENHKNI